MPTKKQIKIFYRLQAILLSLLLHHQILNLECLTEKAQTSTLFHFQNLQRMEVYWGFVPVSFSSYLKENVGFNC